MSHDIHSILIHTNRVSPRLSGRPNGVISPIASSPARHAPDTQQQQQQQQQQQHQIRALGNSITTGVPSSAVIEDNNNGTPGGNSTASPSPLSCNPLLGSSEYLKPLHELPRHLGNNGKIQSGLHAPPSYTQGTLF